MLKSIIHRLFQLVLVMWSVGTLTFVLTRSLPGDMAYRIAGSRYGYDQTDSASAELVRTELGLDKSWWQSYIDWLIDLVQSNLGKSLVSGQSVWEEIAHQFGHTLALAYHSVQLIYLIEGVVIVESLFAWPGSGHALVHAIIARDVPMIQGAALIMGGLFVMLNMVVDMLSSLIDPRIDLSR